MARQENNALLILLRLLCHRSQPYDFFTRDMNTYNKSASYAWLGLDQHTLMVRPRQQLRAHIIRPSNKRPTLHFANHITRQLLAQLLQTLLNHILPLRPLCAV